MNGNEVSNVPSNTSKSVNAHAGDHLQRGFAGDGSLQGRACEAVCWFARKEWNQKETVNANLPYDDDSISSGYRFVVTLTK